MSPRSDRSRRVPVLVAVLLLPALAGTGRGYPDTGGSGSPTGGATGGTTPGGATWSSGTFDSGVTCDELPEEVCTPWNRSVQGECPLQTTASLRRCEALLGDPVYADGQCCWPTEGWAPKYLGCGCAHGPRP